MYLQINFGGFKMDALEPKKLALIRILQILEKYSDSLHPLTQEAIAQYLERDYGVSKTVGVPV